MERTFPEASEPPMKEHGPWKILGTRSIFEDAWIRVLQDDVLRPDGRPGTHDVIHLRSGVTVLALDDRGVCHLTEEFHYAVGRVTLEGVSGGIEDGENPDTTAQRELQEELGLEASQWTDLGRLDPVTSIVSAPVRLFLARGLTEVGHAPEGTELIRRVEVPLQEAVAMVLDGRITHAATSVVLLKTALMVGA